MPSPRSGHGSASHECEGIGAFEKELTLDLEPGTYVLLCNLVEEETGEVESHLAEGMHATFTVE